MSLFGIYSEKENLNTIRRPKALEPTFKRKTSKTLVMFIFLILLSSCAHKPVADTATPALRLAISPDINIFILQPLLKFERVQDEAPLPASDYQGDAIEASLFATARNVIESRKLIMVDPRAHQDKKISELCDKLRTLSPKLSRGIVSDEIEMSLKQLASINERITVLAQLLRVKIGPGGYWNPSTGQIGSPMSSSLLQASLIHCGTGQTLWRNQVFLRGLPSAGSSQFSEMLKLLYQDFPGRKEE